MSLGALLGRIFAFLQTAGFRNLLFNLGITLFAVEAVREEVPQDLAKAVGDVSKTAQDFTGAARASTGGILLIGLGVLGIAALLVRR